MLCSSTGASSGELCLGNHGLKNVAVGMLQMDDALRARAERLKQMCNALANLHAYKLTNLGSYSFRCTHSRLGVVTESNPGIWAIGRWEKYLGLDT